MMHRPTDVVCTLLLMLFFLTLVSQSWQIPYKVCKPHQFACKNGKCVPKRYFCDKDNDCGDNTDEDNCGIRMCDSTEFKCRNHRCIPSMWLCDEEDDCGDKSDEDPQRCPKHLCGAYKFRCAGTSEKCIPLTWRCDGEQDCDDGLDEENCRRECSAMEFKCDNENCIQKLYVCDDVNDCDDMSDEDSELCRNKTCGAYKFSCGETSGICISENWRCDGEQDCDNGSDEDNCDQRPCRDHEFTCRNRNCIPHRHVCDGDDDCGDKTDEMSCLRLKHHLQENVMKSKW